MVSDRKRFHHHMNKRLMFVALFSICFTAFAAGFFLERNLPKNPPASYIPFPPEFLTSPLIGTFYANVEGTVRDKKKDFMILQKDNKIIKVLIAEDSGLTTFGKGKNEIKFEDIKIGDSLKGGISIIVKPTPSDISKQRKIGDIVGHRFTVL